MYRRALTIIFVIFLATSWGNIAAAFDNEKIQMHGFVSQGYLDTTQNDFLGKTKEGTYEFNEIAVSFSMPLTDELRFGCQFFSRDIAEYGNNELLVDWAFLDYRWKDFLGFRAGKMRMPFGLYNRQRDADMLRTCILLPQSVYSESYRQMVIAIQGAGIYGSFDLGAVGEIEYELMAGTFETESLLQAFIIEVSHAENGMLVWNTPFRGLRFSVTYNQATGDVSLFGEEAGPFNADEYSVYSAEYEWGKIKLSAEYSELDTEVELRTVDLTFPIHNAGWYVGGAWSVLDWLQLGAYYADFKDKEFKEYPLHGVFLTRTDDWDYYTYQKDTTLSLRFNLSSWWCIKFEAHFIEGVGRFEEKEKINQTSFLGFPNFPIIPQEKNWNMYAVKTSLHF